MLTHPHHQKNTKLQVAIRAAEAGAAVVMAAADKPRNVTSKGSIGDIVTDTDKAAEAAIVAVLQVDWFGRRLFCR